MSAEQSSIPDLSPELVTADGIFYEIGGRAVRLKQGMTITFEHSPKDENDDDDEDFWVARVEGVDLLVKGSGSTKGEASEALREILAMNFFELGNHSPEKINGIAITVLEQLRELMTETDKRVGAAE